MHYLPKTRTAFRWGDITRDFQFHSSWFPHNETRCATDYHHSNSDTVRHRSLCAETITPSAGQRRRAAKNLQPKPPRSVVAAHIPTNGGRRGWPTPIIFPGRIDFLEKIGSPGENSINFSRENQFFPSQFIDSGKTCHTRHLFLLSQNVLELPIRDRNVLE